jgi:hypothetical protein
MTRGCSAPRQGAHRTMIENYDESVVVYGSGFVCHVEEVSAVVYGNRIRRREGAMWCRYPLIALICLLHPSAHDNSIRMLRCEIGSLLCGQQTEKNLYLCFSIEPITTQDASCATRTHQMSLAASADVFCHCLKCLFK